MIDVAVLGALVMIGAHALRADEVPPMVGGLCPEGDGVPVIPAHVTIAAVFATIDGPDDVARWSMQTLGDELRGRGFRERSGRFVRDDATIELVGALPDDAEAVTDALDRALASHDIVYYNGHNFGGELEIQPPSHRILVLDTCWSAQHYGAWSREVELIANSERAITGSVYSFVDLLDGLLARDGRSWRAVLAPANAAAADRAALRPDSTYPEPERYGLIAACQGQGPTDEP